MKNRVVLAPLTRGRCPDGRVPTAANALYYAQRSGCGLIISEATGVSPLANGWVNAPGLYTDEMQKGWKGVVDEVHAKGGVIFLQLWFIGRASHSSFMPNNGPVLSASAVPIAGEVSTADGSKVPAEVPHELSVAEIKDVVESYGLCARRAKEAGFDGVEVHAANGYLIDQFLQTCSNVRDDAYGGSVENRFRFCKEVVARVLQEFPPSRVGVKISPNGVFNGMGSEGNFTDFLYFADQLEKQFKIAYLHCMDGLGFGYHNKASVVELEDLRKVFKGTLVGNVGYTRESAAAKVESGAADAIAFGRPYIANPDLAERFKNDWPLAEAPSVGVWYGVVDGDVSKGYSDFPAYEAK